MALKKKVFSKVEIPEGKLVQEVPVVGEVAQIQPVEIKGPTFTAVIREPEVADFATTPLSISSYPFRTIERWVSDDGREIRKLEACPYGSNGIVLKTSTRFLDASGNVTACSEALASVPGVSMFTFEGKRRGQKGL